MSAAIQADLILTPTVEHLALAVVREYDAMPKTASYNLSAELKDAIERLARTLKKPAQRPMQFGAQP